MYVERYRQEASTLVDFVQARLAEYDQTFPFHQLVADDTALVHGDLHAGNIVVDSNGSPFLIDFDSAALGPSQYDMASWVVRAMRGDRAPVESMRLTAIRQGRYKKESFEALTGWKILSSMSHILRYSNDSTYEQEFRELQDIAVASFVPGVWNR